MENKLGEWAAKLGVPVTELQAKVTAYENTFRTAMPGQTDQFYKETAIRRVFLDVKSELASPAKPFDMISLGASGIIPINRNEIAEKKALYADETKRAQAIAEGKVAGENKLDKKGEVIPLGTPLDTREYFVPPDPNKPGDKGSRNPNYGYELKPQYLRTTVGFGRPAKGGQAKIVVITSSNEQAMKPIPPAKQTVRARLNEKRDSDNLYFYYCNASRRTTYMPIKMPEYPNPDDKQICEILQQAPPAINPGLAGLMDWHEANAENKQRLVVFEGDVTFINPEVTEGGSRMVIIVDASNLDFEAEGTTLWVPEEIPIEFGNSSHVYGIARTNKTNAYDREARQQIPDKYVIQLAVVALFADPVLRTPPEETGLIGEEE